MPPTSNDLDLFILALIKNGCANTYALKSKAGISVGSSAPVLERLEQSGLVRGSGPGVRARRHFVITKSGQTRLESSWQQLLSMRPTDPDVVLRITYLTWALGRKTMVSDFIDASAITLGNAAATRRAEANLLRPLVANLGGEAFRWLKTSFEAARFEAQSSALKELGKQINKQKKK